MTDKERLANDYLNQIYRLSEKIKRLELQREDLRQSLYTVGSPMGNMDTDRVQTSQSGDSMLRMISRVDLLEREILQKLRHLIDRKNVITDQIEAMDDGMDDEQQHKMEKYKTVLFERYVLCRNWEIISQDMGYDIKWLYELRNRALDIFAEKYKLTD